MKSLTLASVPECAQTLGDSSIEDVCHGLFPKLLPPPARILVVGLGCGNICAALVQQGYTVTGVDSNPASIQATQGRCPSALNLVLVSSPWQNYEPPRSGWDVALFHESLRFCDPLAVYGKAYDVLVEGGRLVILDEVATQRSERVWDGLHTLDNLLTLAARCSFVVEEQRDLTAFASQSIEHWLNLIDRRGHRLYRAFRLNRGHLAELVADLQRRAAGYTTGSSVYLLLVLRKAAPGRWRVSNANERDLPAVFALFHRVFGHEMSLALWRWKYAAGRGQGAIAWQGDKVVAHYGAITRTVSYFGECKLAGQVGDVMVDPDVRGVLTRKGPFLLTAASLLEACCGFGAKYPIAFGFPNARAMQVGARRGLYAPVGTVAEVYWSPAVVSDKPALRLQLIERGAGAGTRRAVGRLWRAMQADLGDAIVGVRDWAWLVFRYLSHPHYDYRVLLVRGRISRRVKGVIVLRRDGERCELLDLIAPLKHIPLLLGEARRLAAQWDTGELYCWITACYAWLFETEGGTRRELDIIVPTNVWTAAPEPAELRDHWWLMSGDTDFH